MSDASRIIAAILLIAVLTVEFGGLSLLAMLTRRIPGYLYNPLRQTCSGHAGVWVVFALVALLWVGKVRQRPCVGAHVPSSGPEAVVRRGCLLRHATSNPRAR